MKKKWMKQGMNQASSFLISNEQTQLSIHSEKINLSNKSTSLIDTIPNRIKSVYSSFGTNREIQLLFWKSFIINILYIRREKFETHELNFLLFRLLGHLNQEFLLSCIVWSQFCWINRYDFNQSTILFVSIIYISLFVWVGRIVYSIHSWVDIKLQGE